MRPNKKNMTYSLGDIVKVNETAEIATVYDVGSDGVYLARHPGAPLFFLPNKDVTLVTLKKDAEANVATHVLEKTGGTKYDSGKAPISMIPREALEQEAMVLAFGANKYGRDNWRSGMEYTRLIDAALRHIIAFNDGEDFDSESGLPHLAAARCSLGFLLEYLNKGIGIDDRSKI